MVLIVGGLIRDDAAADGSTRRTPARTRRWQPGIACSHAFATHADCPDHSTRGWHLDGAHGKGGRVVCCDRTGRQMDGGILMLRTRSNPSGCECLGRDAVQALFADAMYSKFVYSLWTAGPPPAIAARVLAPVCHGENGDTHLRAACCCRNLQPSKASGGAMLWRATLVSAPTTAPSVPPGRMVSVTLPPAFPTPTDIIHAAR